MDSTPSLPTQAPEIYDLLLLIDATYNTGPTLNSLSITLPHLLTLTTVTTSFSRLSILAYRAYFPPTLILSFSGWKDPSSPTARAELTHFAQTLHPDGGGDEPEAMKTALARAYEVMRPEATTLVLLYMDAPPHTRENARRIWGAKSNYEVEQKVLLESGSFGGRGHLFADWVCGARVLAGRAKVVCLLEGRHMAGRLGDYYTFLSAVTGGACFYLTSSRAGDISEMTVRLLLEWMGVEIGGWEDGGIGAKLARFKDLSVLEKIEKEESLEGSSQGSGVENFKVDLAILKKYMPPTKQMKQLIEDDISTISLNPGFGSLWRAICSDRDNDARGDLTTAFRKSIEKIKNIEKKVRMKIWLEESYDFTVDIQEAIESVGEDQQFPCVYLDLISSFPQPSESHANSSPIHQFQRSELLEIKRSCDAQVLKRLGSILTRFSFAKTPQDLPSNTKSVPIQRIPLALVQPTYDRKFWKISLHLIVPGTILPAHPAVLLAALALTRGINPLFLAAETEILAWKNPWHTLKPRDIYNINHLNLLLPADAAYTTHDLNSPPNPHLETLLKPSARSLFWLFISYKTLEQNLHTPLTTAISWTPEKATVALGPLVTCISCRFPRSVTVMGAKGKCGNCIADYQAPEDRARCIRSCVSRNDTPATEATWVECRMRMCRAQYVVYNPQALGVSAKCYYCRKGGGAPCVECRRCLSKIIYPVDYHPEDISNFTCPACLAGRRTIVEVETSVQELNVQNGMDWLIKDGDNKLSDLLSGVSIGKQLESAKSSKVCEKTSFFRSPSTTNLTLDGKPVQNIPQLITKLKNLVLTRTHTPSGYDPQASLLDPP
ncbi:hypothetical protein GLAREA_04157 [Glarea lozoyensis ATCC 20868]|uniref:VWFA domain-containing protein n=1 Tax=Glarea lozoyensis (strain ATCC 20868 / MF5171) TaxID=1116229 RepID=S3D011_GLAL2|nr:uncharacterized protein GLAREA_04157 [Glarea lozoyensis ATCC 20868]EPE31190.1 hypothetical protein GLAREA_04157 [Glarea lozoyensis ATCC 20868]